MGCESKVSFELELVVARRKTKTHLRRDNEAKTEETDDGSLDEQNTVDVGGRDEKGEMLENDRPGEKAREEEVRVASRKEEGEGKARTHQVSEMLTFD